MASLTQGSTDLIVPFLIVCCLVFHVYCLFVFLKLEQLGGGWGVNKSCVNGLVCGCTYTVCVSVHTWCVCVYIHGVCVCVCVHTWCVCIHGVCVCEHMCVGRYVCGWVGMCVSARRCAWVWACVCVRAGVHGCGHVCVCMHVCVCVHACTCVCVCMSW